MVAHVIPADTLDAAEERAAADDWGQSSIGLPLLDGERFRFLVVEWVDDCFEYTEVAAYFTDDNRRIREERLVTRAEALALLAVRS